MLSLSLRVFAAYKSWRAGILILESKDKGVLRIRYGLLQLVQFANQNVPAGYFHTQTTKA